MADDNSQRSYRSNDFSPAPGKGGHANDPLAELARLIGQNDPFAEFGRKQQPQQAQPAQHQEQWAPQPYATPSQQHGTTGQDFFHAGQDHSAQDHSGQEHAGYDQQAAGYDDDRLYQDDPYRETGHDYDDVPPSRRRWSIIGIAAVVALAVIGTAGAVGYRALFGSSGSSPPPVIKAETTPTKVVPASKSESQSSKLIYDRVGERSNSEKLVSREEQPLDISKSTQAAAFPSAIPIGQAATTLGNAGNAGTAPADQPKKIRTIVIRPDQLQGAAEPAPQPARAASVAPPAPTPAPAPVRSPAPQRLASAPPVVTTDANASRPAARPAPAAARQAPPRNAPLSLSPNAVASAQPEPVRTASAPAARTTAPAASAGGQYAVQISSQRSEEEAQAAFRALQAKHPAQLSGRQPLIRRADLGSKGIYYRAMVGPFASSGDASQMCQSLKAAGVSCFVQKN